jgi:pimeloyl-ACP methyl ester carboxylesterase
MRRAQGPSLLVGGTADQFWDGRIARSISDRVVEVEKADHGMFVPGPVSASAEVLARTCDAVEEFLDSEVWQ